MIIKSVKTDVFNFFGVIINPNGLVSKFYEKAKLVSFYPHNPFWLFLYTFGGTPQKVGNSA